MSRFTVVLGVTGGIAATKSASLASMMTKAGMDVRVIMTRSAMEFVTPLTFRTLTGNQVAYDMFAEPGEWSVRHVSLAQAADIIVVAPATANFIGKVSCGIADDMLTTTVMASCKPIIIAPAMNDAMYRNPIVQRNIDCLRSLGYRFIGPAEGRLACGTSGMGRMVEPEAIFEYCFNTLLGLGRPSLAGHRIVITAGPTYEPIDPVRFIGNRSSGKMGYALAAAAHARGGIVHLVSGPTSLTPPFGVSASFVSTARDMHSQTMALAQGADIVIGAAAVADFRPTAFHADKMKKAKSALTVRLVENPDIMADLGHAKTAKTLIGFAAETSDLLDNANLKLKSKNLDMVVANDVSGPDAPFGSDTNTVTILTRVHPPESLPAMSKAELAHEILDRVMALPSTR